MGTGQPADTRDNDTILVESRDYVSLVQFLATIIEATSIFPNSRVFIFRHVNVCILIFDVNFVLHLFGIFELESCYHRNLSIHVATKLSYIYRYC